MNRFYVADESQRTRVTTHVTIMPLSLFPVSMPSTVR